MYFLAKKSDAASAPESFLADVQANGTRSAVMCVRSDKGGGIFEASRTLCRKRRIKREFRPADSLKYNGVAELALAPIGDAALAAHIQA